MNRRLLLKACATIPFGTVGVCYATNTTDQILGLDCIALVKLIRDGSVSAEQVCAKFLEQYERKRSLNVVTWINPSQVISRARDLDRVRATGGTLPLLAGLPILVKDNIDTVGFPTSAGTASLKRNFPNRNAAVVEQLLKHGAIVLGKANMHELGFGATSSNPTFGCVRNPYNLDLIPGGSSGGSAAAVAARIAPVALGTDTAGSIRIPAAFCGIVGFRPSTYPRKLYSQTGTVPVTLDLDTVGPMGRSVADVVMLHTAIVGQRPGPIRSLQKARIGIPRLTYWEEMDSDVERVAEAALRRLQDRGAVLVEIDLREVTRSALKVSSKLGSIGIADLRNFLQAHVPSVSVIDLRLQIASRDVRARVDEAMMERPAPDLINARDAGREAICNTYRAIFRQHRIEAVVFPTEVIPPPPIQSAGDDPYELIEVNGRAVSKFGTLLRNTVLAPALGAPALSLPAGLTSRGLPVALEFDGLPGEDGALLALGRAAEAAIGRVPAPLV